MAGLDRVRSNARPALATGYQAVGWQLEPTERIEVGGDVGVAAVVLGDGPLEQQPIGLREVVVQR